MRFDPAPPFSQPGVGASLAGDSASSLASLHLTESIQSHGVLAALDADGYVTHLSANAMEMMGASAPVLGERLRVAHVAGDAELLASFDIAPGQENIALTTRHRQVALNGNSFELLVHRVPGPTLVEWESCEHGQGRQELGPLLHRLVKLLRQQRNLPDLLTEAVNAVRTLTGLERVMVYRFRGAELGGGEVVAESHAQLLSALMGSSFTEELMPSDAKRLAQLTSVRLIADTHSTPVALLQMAGHDVPLDLTHAALRSAAEARTEYLRSCGHGATLTMPLVVNDEFWGIVSCHHSTRLHVPYPVRSVCAVLAELLSAQLQSLLEQGRAERERVLERLRTDLLDRIQGAAEPGQVLAAASQQIASAYGAHAVLFSHQSHLHVDGDVAPEVSAALRSWLAEEGRDDGKAFSTDQLALAAPALAAQLDGWAGLLSICYDPASEARLVLLRRSWSPTAVGDGSEDDVESAPAQDSGDTKVPPPTSRFSQPWTEEEVAALDALGADLRRLIAVRVAEMHRYRAAVRAMLHTKADDTEVPETTSPESRFERVLHQAMELSLMRQGVRPLTASAVDIEALLRECVASAQQRHHDLSIYFDGPGRRAEPTGITTHGEPERLTRLLDSLLDNAIRHGQAGEPVVARVSRDGAFALVEISNISPPIDPRVADTLFSATEPATIDDSRSGLGFGLYIGQTIAQAHGGTLTYAYEEPFVTMAVRLPTSAPA